MKKLLLFLSLYLTSSFNGFACGPYDRYYLAKDYCLFRACGNDMLGNQWNLNEERTKANCKAWAEVTSENIPSSDIHNVVYKWSLSSINQLRKAINHKTTYEGINRFAKWIVRHKDLETLDFLQAAKTCENIRSKQNTLWYYPVDGDDYSQHLETIVETAKNYKGKRFCDRYNLQAIRALFAMQQYGDCINLWLEKQHEFSEGVIKEMAVDYIAGCYIRLKQPAKAKELYLSTGDPNAAVQCGISGKERFDAVYSHNPNNSWLISEIQRQIHDIEIYEGTSWPSPKEISEAYRLIYEKVSQICQDNICDDMSPWYYSLAFLSHKLDKADEALESIIKAEYAVKNSVLSDAIHILKLIIVTSQRSSYTNDFENYLFNELKWLDNKIVRGLDVVTGELIRNFGMMNHINGQSQYYWSDMMRKLLIGYVAPLCIQSDYKTRALQYLNYADYSIFNVVNNKAANYKVLDYSFLQKTPNGIPDIDVSEFVDGSYIAETTIWKELTPEKDIPSCYEYRNDFFVNLDSIGVKYIQRLIRRYEHPLCPLDKFLSAKSYTDLQYLNDIVGTQLIAAMKYDEAIEYLSKVSANFNRRQNVYLECRTDDPFTGKQVANKDAYYRLHFAKKMASLEKAISEETDVNKKASYMLTFAHGLMHSIGKGWSLTTFYRGEFGCYPFYSSYQVQMYNAIEERFESLVQEALSMFTDREMAAKAYYDWKLFKTAATKFPETETARFIRGHCDQLVDYRVRPAW